MLVFISYAREDIVLAKRLYHDLENQGFRPWMDAYDMLPGARWKPAIREAIKKSQTFLALLSKNSVSKRGFVNAELKQALEVLEELPEEAGFLIPVRLEECRPPEVSVINEFNWVDLFPSYEKGLKRIIEALHFQQQREDDENDRGPAPQDSAESASKTSAPEDFQEAKEAKTGTVSEEFGEQLRKADEVITYWAAEQKLGLPSLLRKEILASLSVVSTDQLRDLIIQIVEHQDLSSLVEPQHRELVTGLSSQSGQAMDPLFGSHFYIREVPYFDIPGRLIRAAFLAFHGSFREALSCYWDLLGDFNPRSFKDLIADGLIEGRQSLAFSEQVNKGRNFAVSHRKRSAMRSLVSTVGIATVWSDKVGGMISNLFSPPKPSMFDVYSWEGKLLLSGDVGGDMIALTHHFLVAQDPKNSNRLAVRYIDGSQRFEVINFPHRATQIWLRLPPRLSTTVGWHSESVVFGRARIVRHKYAAKNYKGESGFGSFQGTSMRGSVYEYVTGGRLEVSF